MNPWGLSSDAHENDWSPRSQFETKVLEAASIGRRNKQSLMMFTCAAASMMATSTVAFRQPWIIWPCNEIFQFRPIRMHGSTTEIPFPDASVNACREIFQQRIRQGFCAGIELSDLPPDHPDSLCSVNASAPLHWLHKSLHPAEVRYGLQISSLETRQSFWMGRLAMRRALRYVDPPLDAQFLLDHAILKDPHGRPLLPQGYYGSISHKGKAGVALVSSTGESVGVDLEDSWRRQKINVAPKVLTRAEIATLGNTPDLTIEEDILVRFSLKESLYKALHPLVCQYISFQEAEAYPMPNGEAQIILTLKTTIPTLSNNVTANWQRVGRFFLTSVSVPIKI